MKIKLLLRAKGTSVATIHPDATVADALGGLAHRRVGALVVSVGGTDVAGIVSERDVVRGLHERGTGLLEGPVSAIMSTEVHTCGPEDDVEALMDLMTNERIRHVPVVAGGVLAGIVSIGDVVKARVDALVADRQALNDYITAR